MKRLVPLAFLLAVVGSMEMNCRCDHHGKPVCGEDEDALKVVHQLKFFVKNGEVTASVDGSCPLPCPGNSPIVNSFPINGLDTAGVGACNPERARVDPGTAGKGKCTKGSVQYVDTTGTLVITNAKGETCAGSDLEGASFTVRTSSGSVTLTIDKVAAVPYTGSSSSREGYRIVASLPGSGSDAIVSVCDSARAGAVRKAIGLQPMNDDYSASVGSGSAVSAMDPVDPWADYAIAIPGPLYSNHVKQISFGTNFFNLACAGNALAKRTLDQITKPSDSDAKKFAALRMLTAAYCNRPRTTAGMKFHPEPGNGSGSGDLEARWAAIGAACLGTMRLAELSPDFSDVHLGSALIPAGCGSNQGHEKCHTWDDFKSAVLEECAHPGSDDETVTVDGTCDGSDSGTYAYKSFVPSNMYGSGSGAG